MKRFITGTFEVMLGLAFVLVVLSGAIAGFPFLGPIGAAVGCLLGFVIASVSFGALYILIEIRDLLRSQSSSIARGGIVGQVPTAPAYTPAVSQPMQSSSVMVGKPIASVATGTQCPHCGYTNAPGRATCGYCSKPTA